MTDGLTARITFATKLLEDLLKSPLEDRDWKRIKSVCDSINHNNKILNGGI